MENLEIGKIHEKEQNRDAVHMAIAPVVAGERLRAGKHIAIVDGKAFASLTPIGIVDPFLAKPRRCGAEVLALSLSRFDHFSSARVVTSGVWIITNYRVR